MLNLFQHLSFFHDKVYKKTSSLLFGKKYQEQGRGIKLAMGLSNRGTTLLYPPNRQNLFTF